MRDMGLGHPRPCGATIQDTYLGVSQSHGVTTLRAHASSHPDPNPQYDASMPTSIKTTNKEKGGRTAVSTSRVPVLPYDTR